MVQHTGPCGDVITLKLIAGMAFRLDDNRCGVILPGSIQEGTGGSPLITRWRQIYTIAELGLSDCVDNGRPYYMLQGQTQFEPFLANQIVGTFWALPPELLSRSAENKGRDRYIIGEAERSENKTVLRPIKAATPLRIARYCLAMVMQESGSIVVRLAQKYVRKAIELAATKVAAGRDYSTFRNTITLGVCPKELLALAATFESSIAGAYYEDHQLSFIFRDLEDVIGLPKGGGPMQRVQWGYPAAFKVHLYPVEFSAVTFNGFRVTLVDSIIWDSINTEQSDAELDDTLVHNPRRWRSLWRALCDGCGLRWCICPPLRSSARQIFSSAEALPPASGAAADGAPLPDGASSRADGSKRHKAKHFVE